MDRAAAPGMGGVPQSHEQGDYRSNGGAGGRAILEVGDRKWRGWRARDVCADHRRDAGPSGRRAPGTRARSKRKIESSDVTSCGDLGHFHAAAAGGESKGNIPRARLLSSAPIATSEPAVQFKSFSSGDAFMSTPSRATNTVATLNQVIKNKALAQWVDEVARMCQPERIHVCDGSAAEYQDMLRTMVHAGSAIWMDQQKRPNSIFVRSTPADVARVEDRTYICAKTQEEAGPTNNWREPSEMKQHLVKLFTGCMTGRTLYVIPYSMGPIGSPIAKVGVELSDSPYVVANMHIMARVGTKVMEVLGENGEFVKGLHS